MERDPDFLGVCASFAQLDFDQIASRLGSTSIAADPRRMRLFTKAVRALVESNASGWACALPLVVLGPEDLDGDIDLARAVRNDMVALNPRIADRLVVGECSLIFRVPRYM